MSEELMQSTKMNRNQQATQMNSGSEKPQASKPYLTLRLPKELSTEQGDEASTCYWAHDLRISDNSHSDSNPGQRKKGGCKSVNLTVMINERSYQIPAKCDVRKSFSNRSFAQYYDRSAYAVIPLDSASGLYLTICEAVKGRDGKYFVAMEKSRCSIDQRSTNSRHPLLAFAAESVYRVVIHSTKNDHKSQFECSLQAKCMFQQGTASVVLHRGRTEASDVKVKVEPVERRVQPVVARQPSPPPRVHAAPVMQYLAPAPFVAAPHVPSHHIPVYPHHYIYEETPQHYFAPPPSTQPIMDVSHHLVPFHEPPMMHQFRPTFSVKPEPVRESSVLGKRQREHDTTTWLESKHACLDNMPNQFFPLTVENDIPVGQKMEQWDSSSELDLFDQMSGSCTPSSPFSCDTDECQTPSSPFSDSFSDGVDFSSSDEYDTIFNHPQLQQRVLASPAAIPQSSPFSTPFSWEPFHLNDQFSLH